MLFSSTAALQSAANHHGSMLGLCADACACDPRGLGGLAPGCRAHFEFHEPYCYVANPSLCKRARPSLRFAAHAWIGCSGPLPPPQPPAHTPPPLVWTSTFDARKLSTHRLRLLAIWLTLCVPLLLLTFWVILDEIFVLPPTLSSSDLFPISLASEELSSVESLGIPYFKFGQLCPLF